MSTPRLTVASVAVAVVALAAAGCGGSDSAGGVEPAKPAGDSAELAGEVGPGFDISMTGTDGLVPGTYTFSVDDLSDIHNFHLTGPGVDVSTDVSGSGSQEFTVELEPGEYTFVCDPHRGTMNGSFTVG